MPSFSHHNSYPSAFSQTTSESQDYHSTPDPTGQASLALAQTVAWLSPVQIQALSKTGAATKHVLEWVDEDEEQSRLAAMREKRHLTVDEALALIHRLNLGLETNVELAECFEVTPRFVSDLKCRKHYKDVWEIWDAEQASVPKT